MRFGPFLVPAVVGLTLLVVFGRIGASADDPSSGKAVPPVAATPLPPAASFDLTQLPVGKTIDLVSGDVRVVKALNEPAEFSLFDAELGEFVKQIHEKHKINVSLDVAALTADGKGTETIVNRKTTSTTLRAALRLFLDDYGLTFLVRDESLIITSKTAAETHTPARIYQVHDLTLLPNDPSLQPRFDALKELIQATVWPDSWRDNGGTQGEIHGFEGPGLAVLVITQTDEGHEQIERVLAELRAAKLPALFEMQKKRPPLQPVPTGTVPVVPRLPVVGGGGFSGGGFIGAGGS
jgi:hypothetical protein